MSLKGIKNDVKFFNAKEECAFIYQINDCLSQLALVFR